VAGPALPQDGIVDLVWLLGAIPARASDPERQSDMAWSPLPALAGAAELAAAESFPWGSGACANVAKRRFWLRLGLVGTGGAAPVSTARRAEPRECLLKGSFVTGSWNGLDGEPGDRND
jgi:hypothetical protein